MSGPVELLTVPGEGRPGRLDDAARALAGLPGVREVTVRLDAAVVWTEERLRPDAAATLAAGRARVRERLLAATGRSLP